MRQHLKVRGVAHDKPRGPGRKSDDEQQSHRLQGHNEGHIHPVRGGRDNGHRVEPSRARRKFMEQRLRTAGNELPRSSKCRRSLRTARAIREHPRVKLRSETCRPTMP